MRERLASEVEIDESGLGTDAPERPPEQDESVRVLKVQRDDIVGLDAEAGAEVGAVTQNCIVELTVRVSGALEEQHGLVAVAGALGVGLEDVKGVEAVLPAAVGHLGDALEDAAEHERVVPEA